MGCGASTATNETIAVYDDRLGNMWLDDRRFPAPEMADGNTTYHNWGGLNKQGETSLVLASKEGDPRAVEWILGQASAPGDFSQQFVIDEPNTKGQAPLLAAAQRGHLTICETLHLRSLLRAASEARDAELASAATGGQGGQGARPRGAGFDGDGDLFCAVHGNRLREICPVIYSPVMPRLSVAEGGYMYEKINWTKGVSFILINHTPLHRLLHHKVPLSWRDRPPPLPPSLCLSFSRHRWHLGSVARFQRLKLNGFR